jgi:dTDP-4-dehydrorhamnose 3,5-epimerase-like enzyme
MVPGVCLIKLTEAADMRGSLIAAQAGEEIPFDPRRFFVVYDVPGSRVRGEHAHRQCSQLLICLRGGVSVMVDNGDARDEFRLDRPEVGLLVPPMVWATQFRHTPDAVLLVLASHEYDAGDYIRNYETFLQTRSR